MTWSHMVSDGSLRMQISVDLVPTDAGDYTLYRFEAVCRPKLGVAYGDQRRGDLQHSGFSKGG